MNLFNSVNNNNEDDDFVIVKNKYRDSIISISIEPLDPWKTSPFNIKSFISGALMMLFNKTIK